MSGEFHKKLHNSPILFALLATIAILVGTIVTMFYPMMTEQMHPKLENLKPYTALQLAGRDVYQREGCNNCHTQTVRPLKTEVMRYGEYSKAGEFAYDHPFLWGSKRTGPDLARIGGKYPDMWHYRHFENPQAFFAQSNMPKYGWIKDSKLDPSDVEAHMKALDFPYTPQEIAALKDKTELDALVAYMQVIGTAVTKKPVAAESAAAATPEPVKVLFAVGKYDMPEDAKKELAGLAEDMKKTAGASVVISGYTDKTGSAAANEELAKNRAKAVRDVLRAAGISDDKITMRKPEVITGSGTDEDARRVEARIETKASGATPAAKVEHVDNPLAGNPKAVHEGEELYEHNCESCHGKHGKGDIGPSLVDREFLYVKSDVPDNVYFDIIDKGTSEGAVFAGRKAKGGMPGYDGQLDKNKIWSIVAYIRSIQSK
ncbi:MAG TPA: cbb3-type cytochrome c oxidase subunit II [Dissulfurispiraceae bacterium]|nr:cbb3-type cytochrome c oxidase subunit II [Dissulfurispiraceae bacterium]